MGFGLSLPRLGYYHSAGGFHLPVRYYFLVLCSLLFIHIFLSSIHEDYQKATDLSRITPNWIYSHQSSNSSTHSHSLASSGPSWSSLDGDHYPRESHLPQTGLANATFVILVRNHELPAIIKSIKQMEYSFNHQYHYPYVFLNDEPFTDEFKEWTSNVVSSKVEYGVIPHDHWYQPDHIDEDKARANRDAMVRNGVIYGGSVSYRNMCRFNSGFFFRHNLLQKYRYYWRVDADRPGVEFFCDVDEDPFVFLQENNKVYGFTISMYEYESTVQTLWETTKEFIKENPQYVANDNALGFLSDDADGESYNLCHFWSNFEIADMDFWRSEAYMKYFEYLDSKGGFYYERWGDAPVHSIGVGLFARKDQIHFFKPIGYRHEPFQHCPQGDIHRKGKCWCDQRDNFDYQPGRVDANGVVTRYSCTTRFEYISQQ